jgi:DNA-binding transcriptional LysR family regulator
MDLEELRAFLAVVETGSFLQAERSLSMPRATLRRRVDALEARAQVSLLRRTRQGIEPTEAGAVLATRGRLMIQEATALVASIREIGQEPSGVLRALLPIGLPPHLLVPLATALREAYPKLSVHVRFSADPVASLLDDVDVAMHFGTRSPPGPWDSFEILRVREWPIAHVDYLARRGTPRTLEELTKHELLSWEAPGEDPTRWPLRSGGTLAIEPAMVTTDIHFLRQCVLAGNGIAMVPDAMVPDPGTAPGDIVPVLDDHIGRDRSIRLVVPSVLSEVPKIKAVLSRVRAFTGQL